MKILAIETSCDETGIALLEAAGAGRTSGGIPHFRVLHNLVASQIKIHRPFGGVVPNLAKREHLKNLPILFAKLPEMKPDLITVTVGPGLEPALWTGIGFAKELAKRLKVPLVGANHLEGHLYSFLLPPSKAAGMRAKDIFPAVALIVSGGHTILLRVKSLTKWRRLGETRDDAAGEAFDKVARLLALPYPGGPEIEKLARRGDPKAIAFPRPMLNHKSYDFSFSGLKTSVLYYVRDHKDVNRSAARKADVAASFEEAALDVLVLKTIRAAMATGARSILLSGGVAANQTLRTRLQKAAKRINCNCFVPAPTYNLDNAAMIGAAGYFAHLRKKHYRLAAKGDLAI